MCSRDDNLSDMPDIPVDVQTTAIEMMEKEYWKNPRYHDTIFPMNTKFIRDIVVGQNLRTYINLGTNLGLENIWYLDGFPKDHILKWYLVDCLPFMIDRSSAELARLAGSDRVDSRVRCIHHKGYDKSGEISICADSSASGLSSRGRYRIKLPEDLYVTLEEYLHEISDGQVQKILDHSFLQLDIEGQDVQCLSDLLDAGYQLRNFQFEVYAPSQAVDDMIKGSIRDHLRDLGVLSSSVYQRFKDGLARHNITVSSGRVWIWPHSPPRDMRDYVHTRLN